MILFLGTRPGKARSKILKDISCPHCNQQNTLTATLRPNYFHLFWLPLFRISNWRFVECSHCKKGFFKDEFTEQMQMALEDLE